MLDIADWLIEAGALDNCRAVLTGYLPSPAHVDAAAQIIAKLKAVRPQMFYCCDPICGDNGALYLPPEVAAGLADRAREEAPQLVLEELGGALEHAPVTAVQVAREDPSQQQVGVVEHVDVVRHDGL